MSAFLGPIHIWLFEKIKFQENLNKHLIEMATVKGYNKEKLAEVDSVFMAGCRREFPLWRED